MTLFKFRVFEKWLLLQCDYIAVCDYFISNLIVIGIFHCPITDLSLIHI